LSRGKEERKEENESFFTVRGLRGPWVVIPARSRNKTTQKGGKRSFLTEKGEVGEEFCVSAEEKRYVMDSIPKKRLQFEEGRGRGSTHSRKDNGCRLRREDALQRGGGLLMHLKGKGKGGIFFNRGRGVSGVDEGYVLSEGGGGGGERETPCKGEPH